MLLRLNKYKLYNQSLHKKTNIIWNKGVENGMRWKIFLFKFNSLINFEINLVVIKKFDQAFSTPANIHEN